ncbi:MAG: hypothetical protein VX278_12970, partial [Myxococcota bacterium]|nr:hypothetical protein [Myxococcota bacterium]
PNLSDDHIEHFMRKLSSGQAPNLPYLTPNFHVADHWRWAQGLNGSTFKRFLDRVLVRKVISAIISSQILFIHFNYG